jgi:hypothetical protein
MRLLAASSMLVLLAGGALLHSDAPTPVASAVAGASAMVVRTGEPSPPTLRRAHPPPEASASRPGNPENEARAAGHESAAPASDHLATVTAAAHDASAGRAPQATSERGNASVRRRPPRKNVSRSAGNSRAILAPASSPVNEESTRTDALDDPFTKVPAGSRAAGTSSAPDDLDGLFPGLTRTFEHGANRAPIPD